MSLVHDADVYFDPYDVAINTDPYPTYMRLRDEAPIYHNEQFDFWVLSRHHDVERGLVNWETLSNTRSDILDIIRGGGAPVVVATARAGRWWWRRGRRAGDWCES